MAYLSVCYVVLLCVVGSGFGATKGTSSVTVSGSQCLFAPGSWSSTVIQCSVQYPVGGKNSVLVTVASSGLAAITSSVSFTGTSAAVSFSPSTSGYTGRRSLTIVGSGFWSNSVNVPFGLTHQVMTATVCGQPCVIDAVATTPTSIQCTVPEYVTAASIQAFQQEASRTALLSGVVTGLNFAAGPAFDGSLDTTAQSSYW